MSFVGCLQDIHKFLKRREYHGVRYVFGTGFRGLENLADIFLDLRRDESFTPENAKKTIEDVLVACGYGKLVGDVPNVLKKGFLIGNYDEHFNLEEIAQMQERALFVKLSNSLVDNERWTVFLQLAIGFRAVRLDDNPHEQDDCDMFDDLRELANRKELGFSLCRELLATMKESTLVDVMDDYTSATGNSELKGLKEHDYEWQVSRMKLRNYGRKLRESYLKLKDIPKNEWFWPPLCRSQYVTLAIVSSQIYSQEDYFTHKSLHNQPEDDLPYQKREESFQTIFPQQENDSFSTLVSGRPGIGKTVLLTKVCKEWAKQSCFQNIVVLIHVSLRELHGKTSNPTLLDMAELLIADSEECKQFCQHIEKVSGQGVCFAFDGLDEYPLLNTPGDIVTSIIGKQMLPSASVVVTSRPSTSHKVKRSMKRHVEIIGFMPKEIELYVREYYQSVGMPAKANILLNYLEEHPNVKDMCFLPLHLAMIVHLNDVRESLPLPETESEIYHRFVSHSVIRYILRERKSESEDVHIEIFDEMKEFLNDDEYDLFKVISSIAFHSKAQFRILFNTQDIQKRFPCQLTKPQLANFKRNGLGIVSSYQVYTEYGATRFYSFQHLTFQEFLAAFYISQLEEDEQFDLLEKHGSNPEMREVWKFFFGIVKSNRNLSSLFDKIAECNTKDGIDTLFLSRCIFETQCPNGVTSYDKELCERLVLSRDKKLNISNVILSAPDCSAIGFVLCSAANIVMDLKMNYCQVGENEFKALRRQVEKCEGFHKLKNFQIRSQLNPLKQEGADDLHFVLSKMQKLSELRLYGNQLESDKLSRICVAIKTMQHLQILVLTKNSLGPDCGDPISSILENYPNLIQFYASYNPLTTEGLRRIVPGLLKCTKLQRLGLRGCKLDENAGEILSVILNCLKFLDQLELYLNCLGDKGVRDLSDSLQNAPKLQQVSFTKNDIGDEGGCLLAQAVEKSKSIQQIRLFYNNISSVTRCAFYEVAEKRDKELKYAL